MLTRRLVPNAHIVISFRPILRHFTNHVYLQRQITNDNIKETSSIKGSNTNGKLNPNFSKQKKPSLLGAKEPPIIVHKTDTRTWLEKLKYSFSIESNVKTREYLYASCS